MPGKTVLEAPMVTLYGLPYLALVSASRGQGIIEGVLSRSISAEKVAKAKHFRETEAVVSVESICSTALAFLFKAPFVQRTSDVLLLPP